MCECFSDECFVKPLYLTLVQPAKERFHFAALVMRSIIFPAGWHMKSSNVDVMWWIQVAELFRLRIHLITCHSESWQSASALLWWWWLIKTIFTYLWLFRSCEWFFCMCMKRGGGCGTLFLWILFRGSFKCWISLRNTFFCHFVPSKQRGLLPGESSRARCRDLFYLHTYTDTCGKETYTCRPRSAVPSSGSS